MEQPTLYQSRGNQFRVYASRVDFEFDGGPTFTLSPSQFQTLYEFLVLYTKETNVLSAPLPELPGTETGRT